MSRNRDKPSVPPRREAREERLAAALRANLRRRKATTADDSGESGERPDPRKESGGDKPVRG